VNFQRDVTPLKTSSSGQTPQHLRVSQMPAVLDVRHQLLQASNQGSTPDADTRIHTQTSLNKTTPGTKMYRQNKMTTSTHYSTEKD